MNPTPSMESPGSEIRLYRSGASAGLVELARLPALAPPRAVEGDLRAPEVEDNYGDADAAGPGLFVALVQGGIIVDFARLLFSGGEPSDAEGGPDSYSNASTSDDKGHNTATSGSTGEEVDSDEALAALSLRGGGLLDYEEQWIHPSKWDGRGEEDWEGGAKGLLRGLSNSSRLAENENSSSQFEEALISKIPVQASSRFWRSGVDQSSSEEEDLDQDKDKEDEEEKPAYQAVHIRDDPKGGEEDLSTTRTGQSSTSSRLAENEGSSTQFEEALISKIPVQGSSRFWRSGVDQSSSEEEDLDQDLDQIREGGEEDLTSTQTGQIRTSFCRSAMDEDKVQNQKHDNERSEKDEQDEDKVQNQKHNNERSEKDEQDEDKMQNQKHDNQSGEVDLNSTVLGQSSTSQEQDQIQIDLRLWPGQKHVLIKIWSGGKWVLTKDCALVWLNLQDMPDSTLKVEFSAPFATISGFRNEDCIMDFEINQLDDSSQSLHDVMTLLKPSIRDFQIVKRVGGADACKVFKCLLMGNKCALKSLTQETPWTLEPREVEIISNLKDTNVMVFYQAWIEPWAYKGESEQEYLFIHLEFCPSTLKHALLNENRHWFPNKWSLFEDIVRTVRKVHEARVVHRDLKPDNIFFNSELAVRLGDFGDACLGHDEFGLYGGGTAKLGTEYYFAPELNTGAKITEKADVYPLGVILFELFAMFKTVRERNDIFPNLREEGPHDSWAGDRQLYNLMTALEPSDRPSATQVLDYIHQHHSN